MIFSLLKHHLDLNITDTALKVSRSLYCFTTSISHGVRASLMLFLTIDDHKLVRITSDESQPLQLPMPYAIIQKELDIELSNLGYRYSIWANATSLFFGDLDLQF